jgi:SAM-dependent methyltransferase
LCDHFHVDFTNAKRMSNFYDDMAPLYHLIFQDWDASIAHQGEVLGNLVRERWGQDMRRILDVSCGIGTQAIGLAQQGFQVTGSDLSPSAIARAERETAERQLDIRYSVCDMRAAFDHHGGGFDVVVSCDNSITHLLSEEDILRALKQMLACIRPGGGCLLTIRDYDKEPRGQGLFKPYGTREHDGKRIAIFQVWDFEGDQYDLAMYFVEDDRRSDEGRARIMRSRYHAISPNRLAALMRAAGFADVARIDDRFYQPVLVGTRP